MMVPRSRRFIAITVLSTLLLPLQPWDLRGASLETIQSKIAQVLKRPGVRSTDWGIEILDPTTDEVLIAVNPNKTFKPASVLKVITTATALEKLGHDFKYHTGVYTDGSLQPDGTLLGNLILEGRGDPNLSDPAEELLDRPALEELAEKLQGLGIHKIQGDIVGDDSYFDFGSHGKGWTSQDLKSSYGAPISSLSINNNVLSVYARPTKYQGAVSVSIEPRTSYYRIRNSGVTGSSKSKRTLYARIVSDTNRLVISGVLPAGQGYIQSIPMQQPAAVAASILQDELKRRSISLSGKVRVAHRGDIATEDRMQWVLLAEHVSPPLIRALEIINKRSQNLHAEMLLRTLGAEYYGEGSDDAGLRVVREFLLETGIEDERINLTDGCGLSRENLMTPRFQTALLQYLSTRPYFDLFLNTLAVSGTDGTLKHRLSSAQVKGSIHAKTGTLNGVDNLAGYMTTKSGRNLIFTIFTDNQRTSTGRIKRTIDEICALFVNLY